jgi:ferredoxin
MRTLRYLTGVVSLELSSEKCTGCGMCRQVCPHGVFGDDRGKAVLKDRDACMECGACALNCPAQAITVTPGVGCAQAIIRSWITGGKPSCACGGDATCC